MLDTHVRFVNRGYETQNLEEPKVVTYECTQFSFEEFGTVTKIFLRYYVDEVSIRKHSACIDFFGPFSRGNLLVNLAQEPNAGESPACERFIKPTTIAEKPSKQKKVKNDKENSKQAGCDTTDVIVCDNDSRTNVVYEVSRLLGFDYYVPFKIVIAEGMVSKGYYSGFATIDVSPVALLLGDYNHVFGIRKFTNVESHTLADFHTKHLFDMDKDQRGLFPVQDDDEYFDDDYLFEAHLDFSHVARGLGLKIAMGDRDVLSSLIDYISISNEGEEIATAWGIFFPLSKFLDKGSNAQASFNHSGETEEEGKFFHRDDKGKITFTKEEAAAASELIASMNLDGRVKAGKSNKKNRFVQ